VFADGSLRGAAMTNEVSLDRFVSVPNDKLVSHIHRSHNRGGKCSQMIWEVSHISRPACSIDMQRILDFELASVVGSSASLVRNSTLPGVVHKRKGPLD
jgi:hypothetical protein